MKTVQYVILLCGIFLPLCVIGQAPPGAPPKSSPPEDGDNRKYELEIQKILPLNESDVVVFHGLKVKRFNKTCE